MNAVTHMKKLFTLKVRICRIANTSHKIGVRYDTPQKIALSIGLTLESSLRDSYTHSSSPSALICDHHRRPTKILPVRFLAIQKSITLSVDTMIKAIEPSSIAMVKMKYKSMAQTLNAKCRMHMVGLADFFRKLGNLAFFESFISSCSAEAAPSCLLDGLFSSKSVASAAATEAGLLP